LYLETVALLMSSALNPVFVFSAIFKYNQSRISKKKINVMTSSSFATRTVLKNKRQNTGGIYVRLK